MNAVKDAVGLLPDWLRDDIERSLRFKLLELPILPQSASEAIAVCQSEDGDARQLAKILHREQAIAGNVLRIANSPMFGASVEITSLEQAATRIGMRRIAEVVMLVATQSVSFATPPAWASCVAHLPRLSLVSALYAKEVAKLAPFDADTAFLASLLHDMGWPSVLFLLRRFEEKHGKTIHLPIAQAAGEAYHARVGAELSAKWKLSTNVFTAIKHHEDWAKWDPIPHGAPLVALADQLARCAMPEFPEADASVVHHPSVHAAGLMQRQVEGLLEQKQRILELADLAH